MKTKIIIISIAAVALVLFAVGLASAQIGANQNVTGANPNAAPNNGFWGWIGNCFGNQNNQPYSNPYVAPPAWTNSSVPAPYQGGYGYGYGPCWR